MGVSFCTCNKKKENIFEYKFVENNTIINDSSPNPIKSKKFSNEEIDRLNLIYYTNCIKKLQKMVRFGISSNKDLSTNINYYGKKNYDNSNFLNLNNSVILIGADV